MRPVLLLIALFPSVVPAFADDEIATTCETVARIAAAIPDDQRASTVLILKDQTIVGLSVSDPITATVICDRKPQIVCMETTNPKKVVGSIVFMSGRIMDADERFVVLDPCHSILSSEYSAE